MALLKEKLLINGATVNYWRVDVVSVDKGREQASFALMGYNTKEIAELHPQSFLECIGVNDLLYQANKSLFLKYFMDKGNTYKDVYTACYMYAKENVPFFKDAIDDPEESGIY